MLGFFIDSLYVLYQSPLRPVGDRQEYPTYTTRIILLIADNFRHTRNSIVRGRRNHVRRNR